MKKKLAIYLGISDNRSFSAGNVGLGLAKRMRIEYDFIVFYTELSKANQEAFEKIPHCQLRKIEFPEGFIDHMIFQMPEGRFHSKKALMCFTHFEGFKLLHEYEYALWLDDDVLVMDDLSYMLTELSPLAMPLDITWNVSDQFTDKKVPYPYNGMLPAYKVCAMLLHDSIMELPYDELYDWCFAKAREWAWHLKNPEQAVLNIAIQEFSLRIREMLPSACACADHQADIARQAVIVHFGDRAKVWNDDTICAAWPEWLQNHYEWQALGGDISVDFKLMPKLAFEPQGIAMALYLSGGLGDCLIYKRKIEAILAWDSRLVLDCYVRDSMLVFMHSFFDGEYGDRINAIIGGGRNRYNEQKSKYAIAMPLSTDLEIDDLKQEKLQCAPNLLSLFLLICKQSNRYGNMEQSFFRGVHYAQCEKDGLNCYTSYNRYAGFDIQDFHTHIPMRTIWAKKYAALGLSQKYVTINYGFDGTPHTPINKSWPLERFTDFVRQFKERFPQVQVVQVGAASFPYIAGCDRAFLGESLELVKYILQGAIFHLDIEGGLVHLASQLDTKCVVLFGPTPLHYYSYPQNINIQAGLCHDCCWYTREFQECYRHMSEPECMYSITPELVMEKVEENFATCFSE